MFGRKKISREGAVLDATFRIRDVLQENLGPGWYLDVDRSFPCRIEPDECASGSHPAVVVGPKNEIMLDQFRMDSHGQSAERSPNLAVWYGHHSPEIGLTTFFLHDIQAGQPNDSLNNVFLASKSIVCPATDSQASSKSIAKIKQHFASYLA